MSYDLQEQMIRFWCRCRVDDVDYVASEDMLNKQLGDTAGWSAVLEILIDTYSGTPLHPALGIPPEATLESRKGREQPLAQTGY